MWEGITFFCTIQAWQASCQQIPFKSLTHKHHINHGLPATGNNGLLYMAHYKALPEGMLLYSLFFSVVFHTPQYITYMQAVKFHKPAFYRLVWHVCPAYMYFLSFKTHCVNNNPKQFIQVFVITF